MEMNGNSINPSSIKERIEVNKSILINVTEVNDWFLTELVGEDVLEESTGERILDGRTRTEINKRFFEWLSGCDDASVYKIFLSKLRKYGQTHIANLLDGTPGELPLSQTVRKHLQKMVQELTENIDPSSRLLESLQALGVISKINCQYIKAEENPIPRAKRLLDVLLRGSDLSFEKFKVEIVKTQSDLIELIEQQDGSVDKPHVNQLKKHSDVFARCMDVNLLTIAYLESKEVIDGDMADSLKSTEKLVKKANQVYNFLLVKSKDLFDSFLQAMEENEQKHVANLLKENLSGQQPLSDIDHKRLVKIKPNLIKGIHNNVALISAIRGDRENDESDFAISQNDYEVLTQKYVTPIDKNSALIDAVLRRTDYSLKSLEAALRATEQKHMADLLKEGIMFGADVKTTRTDKEKDLVNLGNTMIPMQSSKERSSEGERQFAENCNLLASLGIPVIVTEASNSIMIYSYCRRPADAQNYIKYLKSGQLQAIYEKMLNLLLKILEPDNYEPLEAAIILKDEDKNIIQEFIEESATAQPCSPQDKSTCPLCGKLMDIFSYDSSSAVCSSCMKQDQSHDCSNVNEEIELQRKKLQEDLQLVSSCRSKSIALKDSLEGKQANFVRQMEESRAAVKKKCDDLREKIENFQQMLLRDQEKFEKHVEGIMGECIRALESYGSVVSDCEDRLRLLTEHGTSLEICKSFEALHERAGKLLKMSEQPSSNAVEIFQDQSHLKPLVLHRSFLETSLDPDSGLIDILKPCLPAKEFRSIKTERSSMKRTLKLIDALSGSNKYDEFIKALMETGQRHIANYLNANGVYDEKFAGEWPAVFSRKWEILKRNRKSLVDNLKLRDFLDDLVSKNVINSKQRHSLLQIQSKQSRNEAFVEMLGRGSIENYIKAVKFFHASGQNDVAIWLGLPPEPAFDHVQVLQFQVNPERERTELLSAFVALSQLGL